MPHHGILVGHGGGIVPLEITEGRDMKPITMTVYMMIDDDENPRKWNVAEWLDTNEVVGWHIEHGHGDCEVCRLQGHGAS